MKKLYISIILMLFVLAFQVKAQSDMIGYGLAKTLPQANSLNPAILPDYKFSLGLPGLSGAHFYSGNNFLTLKNLTAKDAEGNMLLEPIFAGLKNNNRINSEGNINIFHIGFRKQKSYTAVSVNSRFITQVSIPKELLALPYYGNASDQIPNGLVDLNDFAARATAFTEVGISHGRAFLDDKLTLGVKIKYLIGHGIVDLPNLDASIRTYGDNDFRGDSIEFRSNGFDVRAGGVFGAVAKDDGSVDDIKNAFNNGGFGIDLGATFQLTEKISLFASINDLGYIRWSNNSYIVSVPQASAMFTGVDLIDVINGDTDALESQLDSLESDLNIVETEDQPFTTPLTGKLYAGASYKLSKRQTASAIMYSELYRGKIIPAFTAMYNFQYNTFFNFALSGTLMNNRPNIGTGFTFNVIGLQLYLATNDVLSILNPGNGRTFDVRAGLNFTFGNINKVKEVKEKK
jgi:hypothetical protein